MDFFSWLALLLSPTSNIDSPQALALLDLDLFSFAYTYFLADLTYCLGFRWHLCDGDSKIPIPIQNPALNSSISYPSAFSTSPVGDHRASWI